MTVLPVCSVNCSESSPLSTCRDKDTLLVNPTSELVTKHYHYEVADLSAQTTYSVQIAGENSGGRGELSQVEQFTTMKKATMATSSSGKWQDDDLSSYRQLAR